MSFSQELDLIRKFKGDSLTRSIATFEQEVAGLYAGDLEKYCEGKGVDYEFMSSALSIKQLSSQIDVIIHSAGILRSLPEILEAGERVESVSLGAGNTGRKFDLETNYRIAEYKFIDWKGGAESIRQNGIFKDFYELAEFETHKKKYLYVVGTEFPMKFFKGGRALTSVLSRRPNILEAILAKYGPDIVKVKDYFRIMQDEVSIQDISEYIGRDKANT